MIQHVLSNQLSVILQNNLLVIKAYIAASADAGGIG
jgi:hypothetical protein